MRAPPSAARRRPAGPATAATRRSCMRIASEHGIDLEQVEGTGRGGRVRKQDVLAFLENGSAAAEEPPMHIESPYRPDEPAPPKTRKPRFERAGRPSPAAGGASAPLSRMRQSIGTHMLHSLQTAATCTTVVEADLIRIEAARGRHGLHVPAVHRPGDDRDAARVPAAQRHARGRHRHHVRRRAPRHRGLARRGRPDRAGHPRRPGAVASRAWRSGSRTSPSARATTRCSRTRSAAARSRSPTRAATARSSPPR